MTVNISFLKQCAYKHGIAFSRAYRALQRYYDATGTDLRKLKQVPDLTQYI